MSKFDEILNKLNEKTKFYYSDLLEIQEELKKLNLKKPVVIKATNKEMKALSSLCRSDYQPTKVRLWFDHDLKIIFNVDWVIGNVCIDSIVTLYFTIKGFCDDQDTWVAHETIPPMLKRLLKKIKKIKTKGHNERFE